MPRVSDDHLAARRQQILDAARRCFLRDGFHGTSMQDIIGEAGLSVGAVYRYFKSKQEIVTAIAETNLEGIHEAMAQIAGRRRPLMESIGLVLDLIAKQTGPNGTFRLGMQVWAETARDPALAAFVRHAQTRMRAALVEFARTARDRGELPADADVDAIGAVLFGMAVGWALQNILIGDPDHTTYVAGIAALLGAAKPTAG